MALAPAWVVIRVCYLSNIFFSPDFLANGNKPPVFSLPNPAFVYGWIVPKQELHEAIYGEPCVQWTDLEYIPGAVKQTFKEEWLAKGYRKSNYKWVFQGNLQDSQTDFHSPNVPSAFSVGKDHVLIYMTSNGSVKEITRIMEDKGYHDKCKDCMKKTKSMELPPTWFRSNLKRLPKGFETLQQELQPVAQAQANGSIQIVSCALQDQIFHSNTHKYQQRCCLPSYISHA